MEKKIMEMTESDLIRLLLCIEYGAIQTRKKGTSEEWAKISESVCLNKKVWNWDEQEFKTVDHTYTK